MQDVSVGEKPLKKLQVWKYQRRRLRLLIFLLRFPRLVYVLTRLLRFVMPGRETRSNSARRHSFSMIGGGLVRPADLKAMRYVYLDYLEYMDDLLYAEKGTWPVVWSEFNLSNEILRVLDVVMYVPESMAIMGHNMGTHTTVKIIEAAEREGLPTEFCSAGKAAIGAYLTHQAPKPDLLISSSHPCDSVVSSYQTLEYLTKAPLFSVDTPYWDDDGSVDYYADNLLELIGFLEDNTGLKVNWEDLAQVCDNINKTNALLQEYTEMARAVPSPCNLTCLLLGWQHSIAAHGTENGLKFAQMICENAKARLAKGKGFIKKQKIRVIWWDIPIGFHFLEPWLNRRFGAVTVADFMGRVNTSMIDLSSRETMIRDLARTHLNIAMARQLRGPAEFFTEELKRILEEYSGDCMIFTRHQGCKGGWAMGKLIRDVCQKADLPVLFLSTDSFDPRFASEQEIKREITGFFQNNGLA
jgi:benzoyl-CoA reductase/2-hydroxyglutaryl-CoA dehydratase subunit BcrC/BadD/HgdB